METDPIFQPLLLGSVQVKNRLFRSNVTGRFDNCDGSGTQARINWEASFARGGVGAIISSFVPIHVSGRVQPNYAHIDDDDKIPFWRAVGAAVHHYDCRYILQLSHSGRQRDLPGVENHFRPAWTSTDRQDWFHGLLGKAMTPGEISQVVGMFAAGRGAPGRPGSTGSNSMRHTGTCSHSFSARRSTTARTLTAAVWRTERGSSGRSWRRSDAKWDATSSSGPRSMRSISKTPCTRGGAPETGWRSPSR